jgi:hypothetical protein
MEVMLGQYGTDDMAYLMGASDRPGTLRIERIVESNGRFEARVFHVPVGRFDNRDDLTTFVRAPTAEWKPEDVRKLHAGLATALRR